MSEREHYLQPYQEAAKRHAGGFLSLLWASPDTQAARFGAIQSVVDLKGRTILDVGCGRADLLGYLLAMNLPPADYIGLEAIPELVAVARQKEMRGAKIIDADFVANSKSLFVGAEIVVISGALNTLDTSTFYTTIRRAHDAAAEVLVFNFLDSSSLAAASYLTWHRRGEVIDFARSLAKDVRIAEEYLNGDCTIAIKKDDVPL